MDKFEQLMEKMKGMSEDEMRKAIEAKRGMCICGSCPSYNECAGGKFEVLYCATGKSPDCITEMKGCTCPSCPLTKEMGLEKSYYCTRGTEKEQRGMK
jgi:hypothetical protein